MNATVTQTIFAETQSIVTHLSDRMRQYLWDRAVHIESHCMLKREEKIAWMRDVVFCQLNQYVSSAQSEEIGILLAEEAGADFTSHETLDLLGFEITEDEGSQRQPDERSSVLGLTPSQAQIVRAIQDTLEGPLPG